jgi:signal transduction histidine kinase
MGFLALSVPIGAIWLTLLALGLLVGGVSAVAGVGVVILLATLAGARGAAEIERHLVNALLGAGVPAPPPVIHPDSRSQLRGLVREPRTWRALAWLLLRGLAGLMVLAGAGATVVVLVALLVVPFEDGYLQWGDSWRSSAGYASAWTLPVAAAGLIASLHLARQVAAAHVRAARLLLGPDPGAQLAALTEDAARTDERTGLAHDLHDGIGHAVTLMVLQAEATRATLDEAIEPARTNLTTIADTGRRALDDLDDALTALHAETGVRRPSSTLADLSDLIRRSEAVGLMIRVHTDDPSVLESHPATGVAYRIIQEGLTNVLRHAGPVHTTVRVTILERSSGPTESMGPDGSLEVRVHNRSPGRPSLSTALAGDPGHAHGRGLAGLAERVRLLGGRFAAGLCEDDGWELSAVLPSESSLNPSRR